MPDPVANIHLAQQQSDIAFDSNRSPGRRVLGAVGMVSAGVLAVLDVVPGKSGLQRGVVKGGEKLIEKAVEGVTEKEVKVAAQKVEGASKAVTEKIEKDSGAASLSITASSPEATKSPRAARREAMRDADIPTSQQPVSQTSVKTPDGTPAGRQYTYETPKPGGGTQTKSVQHSLTDSEHGPHWEAGSVKPGGQTDSLERPRLTNAKVKVDE